MEAETLEVTHKCPPVGTGVTPCCGKTLFELPRIDRITEHSRHVTCGQPTPPLTDLTGLTTKEISVLPTSVLEPIIQQGQKESGGNPIDALEMKRCIEAVRKRHWVIGMPRTGVTDQDIKDLFGG